MVKTLCDAEDIHFWPEKIQRRLTHHICFLRILFDQIVSELLNGIFPKRLTKCADSFGHILPHETTNLQSAGSSSGCFLVTRRCDGYYTGKSLEITATICGKTLEGTLCKEVGCCTSEIRTFGHSREENEKLSTEEKSRVVKRRMKKRREEKTRVRG